MARLSPSQRVRVYWPLERREELVKFNGKIHKVGVTRPPKKGRKPPTELPLQTLAKAQDKDYWAAFRGIQQDDLSLQPITLRQIAKRIERLKTYYAHLPKRNLTERPRDPFVFLSRADYEAQFEYLEQCRAELRQLFLASERGERVDGYRTMDGLEYKRKDDALLAMQATLTQQLGATASVIAKSRRKDKRMSRKKAQDAELKGHWRNLPSPESAQGFKTQGFQVRRIETRKKQVWQVLARPR